MTIHDMDYRGTVYNDTVHSGDYFWPNEIGTVRNRIFSTLFRFHTGQSRGSGSGTGSVPVDERKATSRRASFILRYIDPADRFALLP